MPVLHAAVATQVVAKEEALEETGAVVDVDGEIPGAGHQQEDQPASPGEDRAQPFAPGAHRDEEQQAHQQRKEDRDRPLGEKPQPEPEIGAQQRARRGSQPPAIDLEKGQGDEQIQHRIGDGRLADDRHLQPERHDQPSNGRGGGIQALAHEPPQRQHPEARGNRRRQPQRELTPAQRRDRGRLQPVDQHRLVVARLAVAVRGDEVAAGKHLTGRLGKGTLVEVVERHRAELPEEGKPDDQRQEPRRDQCSGQQGVEPRIMRALHRLSAPGAP